MNRRRFIATAGGSIAAAIAAPALVRLRRKTPRVIAGGFAEDGSSAGHLIRDRRVAERPHASERRAVVIVGAGIAGLSAAWELHRRGMTDFIVLELLAQAGGNARSGQNEVSAFPWAAHYVPVPDERATLVRELFEELGVLRDGVWEERHLCFAPQERLFLHGEWHPGIEPLFALDRKGRDDFRRFDDLMHDFRASGAFTIPMARGTASVHRHHTLDARSMSAWLDDNGLTSPALRWYVDYACRDDYGARARDTSAWAGVHYFAARPHEEKGPLTWPEGNGWIVKQLLAKLQPFVRTSAPVSRIERATRAGNFGARGGWRVQTPDTTYTAEAVIFAAPRFLAPYVVVDMEQERSAAVYSPWLTANLTLERWPIEHGRSGLPAAWDNVLYDSPALGYVVAPHQSLRSRPAHPERTVWTYYWALADDAPMAARRALASHDWAYWRDRILTDLERAHPDIRECVSRIDVMRHGHAMIRPTPGFLSAPERRPPRLPDTFQLAHSDRSGLSLFEEAQYQGVTAARRILEVLD